MPLLDIEFLQDSFLKDPLRVHCINAWCSTGHLLAQTCIGLLIVSPVLEKLRTFLIEPRKAEIRQAQEQMEAAWSSFAESTETEQKQYQICKDEYDNIKSELECDTIRIVSNGYYNCLSWAVITVILMCGGVDYILGPVIVVAAHPLFHLHNKLKSEGEKALIRIQTNQKIVDTLVAAHDLVDREQAKKDSALFLSTIPQLPDAKPPRGKKRSKRPHNS